MLTSGLTNTPISQLLLIYTIAASIALSILDIKYLAPLHVSPHLFPYGQFWRAAAWQLAGFTNSTEALFAAMLAYHLRVVERAWGKRKMASFVVSTALFTTFLPPLLLSLLHVLSRGRGGYLPSGPTATLFAVLAQYHALIPGTFRYRISTTSSSMSSSATSGQVRSQQQQDTNTITNTDINTDTNTDTDTDRQGNPPSKSLTLNLSDKSTTYLVAAQLALSQFPAMLLPAAVGWFVGVAWRAEFLPGSAWRVPAWVVGEKDVGGWGRRGTATATATESGEGGYENLRRRLEGEAVAAAAAAAASGNAGVGGAAGGGGQRQRRVIA